MLIASLPPVHQDTLLKEIITDLRIGGVRYNTGVSSAYGPREVIQRIQEYAAPLRKPIFIDLKSKQLRVVEWANLPEGPIVINHRVKVQLPAQVYFRGDDCCYELKSVVEGMKIYVDPLPKSPVGRGQAVNILSAKLEVEGGLLPSDCEYIEAALQEGVTNFMLSFVESMDDVYELENVLGRRVSKPEICLKIESRSGIDFISRTDSAILRNYRLVAARDDLMVQIGVHSMPKALKTIIKKDPKAICASRLLMGLETAAGASMADISDLEYMKILGYRSFMLSDGISREHFATAMEFWKKYTSKDGSKNNPE